MTPELSVMTFNLRHGWADDGEESWPRRREAVAAFLAERPSRIIGFQEVNHFQLAFLESCLPRHRLLGDIEDHGPRWEHRPILVDSALGVVEVETFNLTSRPDRPGLDWGSRYPRQATRAAILWRGREIAVYNTHLDFSPETQLRQASVIWRSILAKDFHQPTLLMGDLNAGPEAPVLDFLRGRREFEGLKGDFRAVDLPPGTSTFHGFTGQPQAEAVDWILVRAGLSPLGPAEVKTDKYGGLHLSDHFPVRARLALDRNRPLAGGKP